MRILVLGGRGMAGHMLIDYLRRETGHDVRYTTRDASDAQGICLDAADLPSVEKLLEQLRPDAVINAIGMLNEHAASNEEEAFYVNGLLPHHLRRLVERNGGKLVHISTDCVFSGERGDYEEGDLPDGTSVYARSKAMGEVRSPLHLTIRTSIIGPEIRDNGIGLFAWFMKQKGVVKGYTRVMWNGVTTLQLAKSAVRMLEGGVTGLYHLTAADKASKCELLRMFQAAFDKEDVTIVPDDAIRLDRTLRNTRSDFDPKVPALSVMISEMREWMEGRR
ncbi:SDR family oxidoreductase [Paenibacillus sp. MBLB4367]|uniref:SDR family oxidoreductase n=1 Tax=Paenibacillus sp. MBLB4367 TaxID=3384767 RepID=UPI00390809E2